MKFRLSELAKKVTFSMLGVAVLFEGVAFAAVAGTFFKKAYVITYDSGGDVSVSGPDQSGTCVYTRPNDRCDSGGLALFFGEGCWETPNSHHLTWTRKAFLGRPCSSGEIYVGTPIGTHASPSTGAPVTP